MNSRTKVTVELTLLEAECLWQAQSEITWHADAMEASFRNGHLRSAAYRASSKLMEAIRFAKRQKVTA